MGVTAAAFPVELLDGERLVSSGSRGDGASQDGQADEGGYDELHGVGLLVSGDADDTNAVRRCVIRDPLVIQALRTLFPP
jgi:hypothetical protein